MKLRCLTSLVATMVMASTAGATEVYNKDGNTLNVFGSIIGGHYFYKNDTSKDSNRSFMRYGLIGQTYINEHILGFGMWEHEISLQNVEGVNYKSDSNLLTGYAGIKCGNLGTIDYGRNYGLLYDVGSWTDVVPEFGGDIFVTDNFLSSRASNVITYRNKGFFGIVDGFDFAVQYQGANGVNAVTGRTLKMANGEGYGVSASYSIDNLAASVAYINSKRTLDQKRTDDAVYRSDHAEAYYCGLKYDGHGMYVAATYGENYSMTPFGNFDDSLNPDAVYGFISKAINVAAVAQYQFDFGLRPSVSYLHVKSADVENGYGNYLKKCVTVGTSYVFNNNVSATMDYRINLLSKNDFTDANKVCIDDILALGMIYLF